MTRAYNTATTQQNSGGAVPAFLVGKNKIINGDFAINQRAFTSTALTGTSESYGFDRWTALNINGTTTYSAQTFTPGTAPVAGYEGTNFARLVTSSQGTNCLGVFIQRIENARTFAGQTVTVSFWAKASTGTPQIATNFVRDYGTGGSPSSQEYTNTGSKVTLSTSWARYSTTFTLPSVSGKTFGTTPNTSWLGLYIFISDSLTAGSGSLGAQNVTIDLWGVQVEAGSVATPFQTATGTIQGELAACQRYAFQINGSEGNAGAASIIGLGCNNTTTQFRCPIRFPVKMRKIPSFTSANGTNYFAITGNGNDSRTYSTVALDFAAMDSANLEVTVSSVTTGQALVLYTNNSAAYLLFNAEL